jgi:hypothetical protein
MGFFFSFYAVHGVQGTRPILYVAAAIIIGLLCSSTLHLAGKVVYRQLATRRPKPVTHANAFLSLLYLGGFLWIGTSGFIGYYLMRLLVRLF